MKPKCRLVPIETIETLYQLAQDARSSARFLLAGLGAPVQREQAKESIYELISAVERFAESYNSFGGEK